MVAKKKAPSKKSPASSAKMPKASKKGAKMPKGPAGGMPPAFVNAGKGKKK